MKRVSFAVAWVTLSFGSSAALAAPPEWALRDTQRLEGRRLTVVCSGSGPSIGLARQSALESCDLSAAQQLGEDLTVKSMSVASEREVAFQQEVLNRSRVTGLLCVPRREEASEVGAEVRLWLMCEFDLSKAKVLHAPEQAVEPSTAWARPGTEPRHVTDRQSILTLAVVPACTDMIIRGQGPARSAPCGRNPVSVVLNPDDREIILRADGRLPKSIYLGPERAARGYAQVYLQPNP
jgi:hypothetical protein